MTVDPEVEGFVAYLLDDWAQDQWQIFSEWGTGQQDESDELAATIEARYAEWNRIIGKGT